MGGLNVHTHFLIIYYYIQCCNLNNFGSNEYNFEGGEKKKRNSQLERINEETAKEQYVKHKTTKTNMNLNYDSSKTLILEMETENHELKDKIMINQNGLIGSSRIKKEDNDNSVYFGYKEAENTVIHFCYIILFINRVKILIIIYLS